MNPLTESRQAIVDALTPLGVVVYGAPPEVATPPAAVVVPANNWYEQATMGAIRVTWQVTLMATMQGTNAAALERLEQLVWDSITALDATGNTTPASSPRILKMGTAEVAATDIGVQVYVTTTPAVEDTLEPVDEFQPEPEPAP